MYRKSRETPYLSFVKMPAVVLMLLILVCADAVVGAEEQRSSRLTVNPNAMWIAAVASGFGMVVLLVIILVASTLLLRRYERKRLMLLAPMLARLQSQNGSVTDEPPAATSVNSEMNNHDEHSVSTGQPIGVAHVYYNRGMDVDEAEAEPTQHLDPRPIEIVSSRRLSSGQESSVL